MRSLPIPRRTSFIGWCCGITDWSQLPAARRRSAIPSSWLPGTPLFARCKYSTGPMARSTSRTGRTAAARGRIYRIVPLGFKRPKPPQLGKAGTYDLVATLSHPNGWQRDTAARLLYERQDPAAMPLLARVLEVSPTPVARLQALHALEGLGRAEAAASARRHWATETGVCASRRCGSASAAWPTAPSRTRSGISS